MPSEILNKKIAAIGLSFVSASIVTIAIAYVNAIFLTSYPKSWLPYFFIIQALTEIGIAYGFLVFLKKNSLNNSLYIQIGLAMGIMFFYYLLPFNLYLVPLIFSALLLTAASLSTAIAWDCIHAAFDVAEFKRINHLAMNMGSIGSIISSFVLLALIKKFHTTDVLSYLLFGLILVTCAFIYLLKPLPFSIKKLKHGSSPFRYPLFQMLALTGFVTILAYTFIDYCLKLELAEGYGEARIGEFMGMFLGISNIARFILDVVIFRPLSRWLGPSILLMILPVYWVVTGMIVLFYPTLWAIVLMASGRYVIQFGAYHPGRELMLNILPAQIRTIAQFQLKSMIGPISTITGALALFGLASFFKISTFAVVIILLNLFVLVYLRKLHATYITTLKEEVNLKRFNMEDELNPEQVYVVTDLINKALSAKDAGLVHLGFSLLPTVELPILPQAILSHLDDENTDIRMYTLKNIAHNRLKEAIPLLMNRFQVETDTEVEWYLFDTLAVLQAKEFLPTARQYIFDKTPSIRSGAVRFILSQGELTDILQALSSLGEMIDHPHASMRIGAARILAYLPIGNFNRELIKLISDPDPVVSGHAINTAAELRAVELISDIIARASEHGVYYHVKKALTALNSQHSIPLLLEKIEIYQKSSFSKTIRYIVLLASIPDIRAEQALYQLASHQNILIRTTAVKEITYRSRHIQLSSEFKRRARELALDEARLVMRLQHEQKKPHANFVIRELISRKTMAKQRFLYWLAIHTGSEEIITLIPTILMGEKNDRAKAITLINSIVRTHALVKAITGIFLDERSISPSKKIQVKILSDNWLKLILDVEKNPGGGVMYILQKVFVLRSVELFNHLPSEILFIIAEETEIVEMQAGQTVFQEGDRGDGLYIIVSGVVKIVRRGKIAAELKENQFFGELALIDNGPRTASAIAETEGALLFLDKETFDRITNDLPEVLHAMVKIIMRYLRIYMT